jgi:hypothetical protein
MPVDSEVNRRDQAGVEYTRNGAQPDPGRQATHNANDAHHLVLPGHDQPSHSGDQASFYGEYRRPGQVLHVPAGMGPGNAKPRVGKVVCRSSSRGSGGPGRRACAAPGQDRRGSEHRSVAQKTFNRPGGHPGYAFDSMQGLTQAASRRCIVAASKAGLDCTQRGNEATQLMRDTSGLPRRFTPESQQGVSDHLHGVGEGKATRSFLRLDGCSPRGSRSSPSSSDLRRSTC